VLTLVKFLLEHASVLENVVIQVKNQKSQQDLGVVSSRMLLEVAQGLQRFHRASKHAAVLLSYREEEEEKRQKEAVRVTTKCIHVGHMDD